MGAFVRPGERVLLKPNMLSAKAPEKAVTTHPEVLRGVIELVKEAGGIPLVGDSPGIGGFRRVAEKSGILRVIEETGAEPVEFAETVEVAGQGVFRRFEIARPYMEADRIINIAKLKTHEMMTMTCAVKNLFGAVVGTGKAAWHLKAGADRGMFARMLLEIYLLRRPDLNIVDAITAMEGNGPGSGDPRHVGLLAGGSQSGGRRCHCRRRSRGFRKSSSMWNEAARKIGLDGADRATIRTAGLPLQDGGVAPFPPPAPIAMYNSASPFPEEPAAPLPHHPPLRHPRKVQAVRDLRERLSPPGHGDQGRKTRVRLSPLHPLFLLPRTLPGRRAGGKIGSHPEDHPEIQLISSSPASLTDDALDVRTGALLKIIKKFAN